MNYLPYKMLQIFYAINPMIYTLRFGKTVILNLVKISKFISEEFYSLNIHFLRRFYLKNVENGE